MLAALFRDQRGAVLVYVGVLLSLLVGGGVLAVDIPRTLTLRDQLQNAADAAALAGARELIGTAGAIDRAAAAAAQALANHQDFADGGPNQISVSERLCGGDGGDTDCVRFLWGLPDSDSDPITTGYETTDDSDARFIEVRVAAHTMTATFMAAFGGGDSAGLSARAVAGNDSLVCSVPPMFMCNPSEPAGNLNPEYPVDMAALEGKQIRSFIQGGGGSYTPGNFGLLCPSGTEDQTNCGANTVSEYLASQHGTCVSRWSMTTKTGVNTQKVRAGLNTRFDIWQPQGENAWRSDPTFAPAVNVTQGRNPSTCNDTEGSALANATGLGRDACFADDSCGGRVGDGDWDRDEYFRINHEGQSPATWGLPIDPASVTRYEVYRYEIEYDAIVAPGQDIHDEHGNLVDSTIEDGGPGCYNGPAPSNDYSYFDDMKRDLQLLNDRRLMPVAMANCNALGNPSGTFSFRPPEFLFTFLTEPATPPNSSGKTELFIEVLGPLDGGAVDALVHDVVQIYRR